MKNIELKIVAGLIVIGLAVAGGIYIGRPAEKVEKIESNVIRDSFMSGCLPESSQAVCSCIYDALINKLGKAGFLKMSLEYDKTGEFTDETLETVAKCF